MAAAIGSSIKYTWPAPAPIALSRLARGSTWVEPQGTQMMMRGEGENSLLWCTFLMNCLSICSVTVKSAMTPSFIGRFFFFQAEDGIRDVAVTGVQTCALPI